MDCLRSIQTTSEEPNHRGQNALMQFLSPYSELSRTPPAAGCSIAQSKPNVAEYLLVIM